VSAGSLSLSPPARGRPRAKGVRLAARAWLVLAIGALVLVLLVVVAVLGVVLSIPSGSSGSSVSADSVSALAEREIPPLYLELYQRAAARYRLDWAILAGIGKVECDHGRDPAPSCTRAGAVNSAGAGGPMQFLASTWSEYGVAAGGYGQPDRWNPADAIDGAANYLRASGAPRNYRRAIFAYNHAEWYVDEVESWAAKYRGPPSSSTTLTSPAQPISGAGGGTGRVQGESPTPIEFISGVRAELDPADGHLAWIPEGAPTTVQAMIVAGNELQELPYGPDGHPDPRGAVDEDCSSSVNYVLYRSGVRPIQEIVKDNPLAQDYVNWGDPGPGRWVTIYATDTPQPHVFIVIAGLRLDTSHNGTDTGPNKDEDGPRWRILSYIPTWAKWSVRHPPGL
jgi:hypothetical protein